MNNHGIKLAKLWHSREHMPHLACGSDQHIGLFLTWAKKTYCSFTNTWSLMLDSSLKGYTC